MRWLIRRVTKRGRGNVAYEEDIHYGEVLPIGRGSDQAIFIADLRVALQHARITALGAGRYKIESLILAGIRVDNELTHSTTAAAGAMVEISTTRIQLLDPPVDFDAGVEIAVIDQAEQKAEAKAKARPMSLETTWLSKRRPSWLLFALIALFFLTFPMLAHFSPGFRDTLAAARVLPGPDSWQAGDLAAAHHYFGSDCTLCHEKAFKWVRDESCARCHGNVRAHADPDKFNLPELGDARCAHCHRDHNGAGGLIVNDQKLCADCHRDLHAQTRNASQLVDVGDFGTTHPQFSIDLPNWDGEGRFTPVRTSLATADIKEKSGLKYPHDVHLDPDGIKSPNGKKVLVCATCHVAEPGGAKMKPVDFETMCQECHRLDFDVLEPGRQVPHAKVAEIIYTLDEFYAKRALEGGYTDQTSPAIVQQRRRPGQPLTRAEQVEAQQWARDKSRQVAESLFTGRACTVCHSVSPGLRAGDPWRIAPVRVAGSWFSKAHFTHGAHDSFTCEQCHPATTSKASTELLIPGIDNCRTCHAGESGASQRVASTCTSCHGYHENPALLLTELQSRAKARSGAQ
jgi:hypothetical protein